MNKREEEFAERKNKLAEYDTSEIDIRGQELGWARAAAHGFDVLEELVQCRESNEKVIQEILNALKKIMDNGVYIFNNEEDERISRVVFRVINENRLPKQAVLEWLEGLGECLEWPGGRKQYVARVNTKNFIRCLYFKMMHYDSNLLIIDEIFTAEEKLNRSDGHLPGNWKQ